MRVGTKDHFKFRMKEAFCREPLAPSRFLKLLLSELKPPRGHTLMKATDVYVVYAPCGAEYVAQQS